MTNEELKIYLKFAKRLAKKAGKIMLKYFDEVKEYHYKDDKTIVTEVDEKINKMVINEVKKNFKDHAIDGEEEKSGKSKYTWVTDPIDGTAMYQRHIPVAMFSLALTEEGRPVVGVAYDPFTDTLYEASLGQGAYKNNKSIHVNKTYLEDSSSVVQIDMWPTATYNLYDIEKEIGKKSYIVTIGSIVHAGVEVAEGNFTLALFPGGEGKNCDIAALKIIVEEAGGTVTSLFGEEDKYDRAIHGAIISNGIVHDEIIDLIKEIGVEKC